MKKLKTCFILILIIALFPPLPAQHNTTSREQLMTENNTSSNDIRTPGEFEDQEAVWLAWPAYDYVDELPMADMTAEIIRQLKPYVPVNLIVWDEIMEAEADSTLAVMGIPTDHLTYIQIPYDEPWLRDIGPVFVIADGNSKQMVDFNFNGWGNYAAEDPYPRIEEPVDRLIAQHMGIPNNMTRLIGEGGNREFNGQGIMMCVAPTELQRNPNMTLEEIEDEFKRLFGIEKVIWLPNNLYDDSQASTIYPGPNGEKAFGYGVAHVDELARFVDSSTIILAEVPQSEVGTDTFALVNRTRLEANYDVLKQATDQNGETFNIIRIPAAMTEYMQIDSNDYSHFISSDITLEDGSRGHSDTIWWVPAKSYANFLITNGAVLVPQYWRSGRPELEREKDSLAIETLKSAFPNRDIITFPHNLSLAVNAGGGGIHCITAQEPELSVISAIDQGIIHPKGSLNQNFPNPFTSTTMIRFDLPERSLVNLNIYNMNGQIVKTLISKEILDDEFNIEWNGKDEKQRELSAGVYYLKISAKAISGKGIWQQTQKMILVR